jgi:hypothetical protein
MGARSIPAVAKKRPEKEIVIGRIHVAARRSEPSIGLFFVDAGAPSERNQQEADEKESHRVLLISGGK